MFPFGRNPYSPVYRSYDPYEEMLLQQELQRRRQAEEFHRRRQLEELNRRRAEQLEYARRQAELQRRREAETRYRRQQELEARRRKFSEPSRARIPHVRLQDPDEQEDTRRQSMFDGGIQDLFETLYGNRAQPNASGYGKRSKSSDPRARQLRVSPTWVPAGEASEPNDCAVSDGEAADEEMAPPISSAEPTTHDTSESVTDTKDESSNPEADRSHSVISDVLKSFSDLKASFTFPSKIDFLNSPEDSEAVAPKLAYTPNNAPLHQYEHLLTGLLTKLDAVESFGQDSIRKARKDAVRLIEQELAELDVKKLQKWREKSGEFTVASAVTTAEVEAPSVAQESSPETQAQVDPASIPLPRDEDLENHSSADTSSTASSDSVVTPTIRHSDLPSSSTEVEGGKTEVPQVNPDSLAPVPDDSTTVQVKETVVHEEPRD
ncbi:BAG domain protein [Rhizoctonia solani 123E]|uniref:BAG domain protein n=1 Tax=Rhizoctonia solani 123E TaxID=1423351 RepID=A0A074S8E5_9AGAM|nr:BAG domain protein [Rhizoctonia solani 123E]